MKLTAIAPWFGSKRTLAPEIVRQLGPHERPGVEVTVRRLAAIGVKARVAV